MDGDGLVNAMRRDLGTVFRGVLEQPFEFWISLALIVIALQPIQSDVSFSGAFNPRLADVLVIVWQVGIMLGASSVVAAFLLAPLTARQSEEVKTRFRTLEVAGLVALATSSLVYCVVIVGVVGRDGLYGVYGVSGIALGAVSRIVHLRRQDRQALRHLRIANIQADYLSDADD